MATLAASGASQAGVSAAEAARRGKDLTEVGAERAGNAAGSIPAWVGRESFAPDMLKITRAQLEDLRTRLVKDIQAMLVDPAITADILAQAQAIIDAEPAKADRVLELIRAMLSSDAGLKAEFNKVLASRGGKSVDSLIDQVKRRQIKLSQIKDDIVAAVQAIKQQGDDARGRGQGDHRRHQGAALHGVHVLRRAPRLLVPAQVRLAVRDRDAAAEPAAVPDRAPRHAERAGARAVSAGGDLLAPPGGWVEASKRLAAPPAARRGWVFRALSFGARRFGRSQVPDVFAVFNINARLFWPWLIFASRLMPGGRLPAAERELVILRTAWNCRSRYEWGQHVEIGLRVGLSDAEVERAGRAPHSFAQEHRRLLLAACDELCASQCVSDATWNALAAQHQPRLLVEIMILVGHYQMLAGFLNSAGLALEPPIEAVLQAFHRRIGSAAQGSPR